MDNSDTDSLDEINPLAELADYSMEFVDRCREAHGEDMTLGEIVIIAEVYGEDKDHAEVCSFSSENRLYVLRAIIDKAIENVESNEIFLTLEDDSDED